MNKETKKKLIETLKNDIYYLKTHNKNYTKTQYFTVLEVEEIIKTLEKEDK